MPTETKRLRIGVLIASHNRREMTVRAVEAVRAARSAAEVQVILLDDASRDGTAQAVAAVDPDAIILQGDGNAFWNGGLHQTWRHALSLELDAFLWLNDDVLLDANAIPLLVKTYCSLEQELGNERFILVGSTRDLAGNLTYGGRRYRSDPFAFQLDLVHPDGCNLLPIDTFNGNIVLVPRSVVDMIRINDPDYRQGLGDYDYGLRAARRGVSVKLMPNTLGVCEANTLARKKGFGSGELSLSEQWKVVNTPKGLPFSDWFRITSSYSGIWWPLHFLIPYRSLVFPRWSRRIGCR